MTRGLRLIFPAILLLWTIDATAQSAATLQHFDEGAAHYAKGEYQQALASWQAAVDSGFESAELYYNMGNASYRLDNLGKAMLYYKRAERLEPASAELQHSLLLTSSKLSDKFSKLPDTFLKAMWHRLFPRRMVKTLTLIGLILYVVGMAGIGFRMWSRSEDVWLRRGITGLLILGIPLLVGGILTSMSLARSQSAVVMAEETPVVDDPETLESEINVHEGLVVAVDETLGDWTLVRLPNGVEGWVPSETIEII